MFEVNMSSRQIWAWAPRFLWAGVLIGIALVTAGWVTELVSPRPVAALPSVAAITSPVTVDDTLKLFDKTGAMALSADGLELTGIYLKGVDSGFATFRSAQGPRLIHVGEEVHPGLRLAAIAIDRVTLRGNGSEWQLELKSGPGLPKAFSSPDPPRPPRK